MSTAVLIPCYNEEKTIEKVVKDFKAELPNASIYVYDNNSSDKTAEIAKKAGAIVHFEPRHGKGNVIRAMFRDIDADYYIMVDGDDTYSAKDAKKMVEYITRKDGPAYDMVIGDRLSTTYYTENKRKFHNFGNKLVTFLIQKLFRVKVNDIMTGYRAFSKDFVKGFPILSKGFEIETEMTIHAADKNFKIKEIRFSTKIVRLALNQSLAHTKTVQKFYTQSAHFSKNTNRQSSSTSSQSFLELSELY